MATVASTVMPTQQPINVSRWTQMVKDALTQRNKYAPGTPEYQKWNQLYISRAQHLRTLQGQQPTTQPTTMPATTQQPGSITPISQSQIPAFQPATVNNTFTPVRMPALPSTVATKPIQPVNTTNPSIPTVSTMPTPVDIMPTMPVMPVNNTNPSIPTVDTMPVQPQPITSQPVADQVIPIPKDTGPNPGTIGPGVDETGGRIITGGGGEQTHPEANDPNNDPETNSETNTNTDKEKTANDVASEGQDLEYKFKNKELDLNNQFRYYQTQLMHNEAVQNLQAALKQMRLDFEIQGRQLDNESTQILGDLENRATELANQMTLGMADIDAQKAVAQLQAEVQQQLGNKGLDVDLAKSLAQIEAQTQTGLTQMYLDQEKAAGELGLQKQLGLTEMGINAAGQLSTNRSNERMAAINATGQMAPQMRQIASNERVSFGNMGANLANQSQAINAQRQAQLMQMGLSAQQAIRQVETERQLGLTGQTMQGYATLAQMNQQPENWLSAFYAMRGMNVPQNARTGQAESLGQYLQQLSSLGLNINPNRVATQDVDANTAFRTGQAINPNMLTGDIGVLTNNYNNAAFQGLGVEREDARNITRRMMDAGEYGRAQDANLITGLTNRAVSEGLERNNVLGQRGYDPQHMYNRLIPQLARSDYYKPPVTDQATYDKATYPAEQVGPLDEYDWTDANQDLPKFAGNGAGFTAYDPTNDYSQYFGGAMGA